MRKKNPFGKTVSEDNPYAIYHDPYLDITHKILKTYQHRDNESKNINARWFVASKSPMTFDSYDMGDAYAKPIIERCHLVSASDDWKKAYGN